ncbi:MAG: segregation and condensation protein [Thermoplasmata archaeon]|jgi:segregation and condensation protein A|nr:segregation and condensation protein [Thermoplasmata archaeon]
MAPPAQAKFADPVVRKEPTQATLHTAQVVRHLLWHKAMIDDDDDGRRITDYIEMVTGSEDGEHVAIKDGFHRDLAVAFELVINNHLDPWDMDLSKFAELYLKEAKARGVDLVTAGRIILMAWTVLKLQSQEAADRAVLQPAQPEEIGWEDIPDYGWSEDQVDFNSRVLALPQAPIDEKIRHKGDRRVTLMELLDAFQEVHTEAQQRLVLNEERLQARLSLKRRMRGRVGGMMHKDDLEAEIAETWTRILEFPASPVPFSSLYEPNAMDIVQTFNALLFLAKSQRIQVSQEEFPYGEIWITPKLPEAAQLITQEVKE